MDFEQPGRVFGALIFSPYLFYKGWVYGDESLLVWSVLLFIYELCWICYYDPEKYTSKKDFLRDLFW